MKIIPLIAVGSNSPQPAALILTLESTGIFLGSLVSLSILLGIVIKLITKLNSISSEIKALREDLTAHSEMEGHQQVVEKLRVIEKEFHTLDKRFEIHSQDYVNHKDSAMLVTNGLRERIDHKWKRTEEELDKTNSDVKDLQKYLQHIGVSRG